MLPYLNGSFDMDEIAFRADLSRRELKAVLAEFSAFLVLIECA